MENYSAASDLEVHFDKTVTLSQNGKEIEYGIIDGNNTIVFIKAGLEGSCYGYENKYVRIGRVLNKKHGNKFDYVLSHTGTAKGIELIDPYYSNTERLVELRKDSTVCFNDKIDSLITYKKWFFGHWHSDWGYENYAKSKYVPLYHEGIVIKSNSQDALPE